MISEFEITGVDCIILFKDRSPKYVSKQKCIGYEKKKTQLFMTVFFCMSYTYSRYNMVVQLTQFYFLWIPTIVL